MIPAPRILPSSSNTKRSFRFTAISAVARTGYTPRTQPVVRFPISSAMWISLYSFTTASISPSAAFRIIMFCSSRIFVIRPLLDIRSASGYKSQNEYQNKHYKDNKSGFYPDSVHPFKKIPVSHRCFFLSVTTVIPLRIHNPTIIDDIFQ